jgi:uncharacterized protein
LLFLLSLSCNSASTDLEQESAPAELAVEQASASKEVKEPSSPLVQAARERIKQTISYNPKYFALDYPMGDPPNHTGVCTDVIIRSFRQIGFDFQQLIHEDMKANFDNYPKIWGLKRPDKNIDHRRVPNMMHFLDSHGTKLPIDDEPEGYQPGEIVIWKLATGQLHTGIVSDRKSRSTPLIIHNIGSGTKEENGLFAWEIIGHYSYP